MECIMNFLQIFKITSYKLLFKLVGWLNSEAILHVYISPTKSIVATSSTLIYHYWSPYLFKREIILEAQLTGLGLWKIKIGTLEDQVQEDFNYPNHDPDRNRLFYLSTILWWGSFRARGIISVLWVVQVVCDFCHCYGAFCNLSYFKSGRMPRVARICTLWNLWHD